MQRCVMRDRFIVVAAILAVFAGSYLAKGLVSTPVGQTLPDPDDCRRIVSMAPSITEVLFALGLDERVVGVTRYCSYPPEAADRPKVGGYHDPNFEAIVALNPHLVIALTGNPQEVATFNRLQISTLVVSHNSVEGILESIEQIGRRCGAPSRACEIVDDIEARIQRVKNKSAGLERPRVLFAVDRTIGRGLEDVYVVGSDGFFEKIVEMAGGVNAYPPCPVRFPVISAEGILSLNPDVIIDMSPGITREKSDIQAALADWQQLAEIEAIRHGRVYPLTADYAFVPGPRFILLIERLARLIHPEVDWKSR